MVDPEKVANHPEIIDPFYFKDPELFNLYKRCVPPREAYYYFPKGEEIIIPHKKKPEKALRRIHVNVPFTDLENKWLNDYKKIINSHPENELPDFWSDAINLRFIYSCECDLKKAYGRMVKYIKWYSETFPLNIQPDDQAMKLLNSGFCYIYGRDHYFRPIIICQPYILQNNKYDDDDVVRASMFICQFMQNNMLIPGQVENWIIFINLEGVSVVALPDAMKKLVSALSDNFLARLYKSYILGMSLFLRILYRFVCNFLEEITVRKVVVLNGKKDKNLFADISPQNLEKRFGGQAPDLVYGKYNGLFPPRMPSDYYFKDDENPNEILITENEYLERYKKGLIPKISVSPYILDDLKKKKEKEDLAKKLEEEKRKRQQEIATLRQNRRKKKSGFKFNVNLRLNTESFDLDKFKHDDVNVNFMNDVKSFARRKNKFCGCISTLNTEATDEL